jgi:hypothetical protein
LQAGHGFSLGLDSTDAYVTSTSSLRWGARGHSLSQW